MPTHNMKGYERLDVWALEYTLQLRFWLIGIFIAAFWFATIYQEPSFQDKVGNRPTQPRAPYQRGQSTAWLRPYLTSQWRKGAAVLIYLAILSLQLLEGYWIVKMDARMLKKFWVIVRPRYTGLGVGLVLRCALWPFLTAFMTVCALATIAAGFLIVFLQLICLFELATQSPGDLTPTS
ncbi:Uu.00g131270.m01.CDS01 [Anthostomella pinea]|uniref:Uu.00g131270.m01.CDS01 n=1 Tax=Anthostomella pinea TaxID=933095 RepID=A0AAI8VIV8_9PEZI|nr:Uu.00g131270.m01.CDS01 [Anthostomella pinea]